MSIVPVFDGTTLEHLASRLEADVRARSMRPGDRYLSTRQVSRQFEVSLGLANQAIQKLVEKDVLVRRDRSGTYVSPSFFASGAAAAAGPRVRTLYVLIPEARLGASLVSTGIMVDVLYRTLPAVNVQFSFVPAQQDMAFIQELISPAQQSGQLLGVIAISCSREVYRYLSDMSVPLVVFGSPDPDQQHIPSVDEDNFEAGRLLAEYLIARGHRRLALLGGGVGRPGDHHFLDGIAEAMTHAGLPPNALAVRLCPHNLELFGVQAQAILNNPDRPTGIICRGERVFDIILAAAAELHLAVPDDVEVVFQAYATSQVRSSPYPHVETTLAYEEIIERLGRMIDAVRQGAPLERHRLVIPVALREPEKEPGPGRMRKSEVALGRSAS